MAPSLDNPPVASTTKQPLTSEQKKAARLAVKERKDLLNGNIDEYFEHRQARVVALAEEHGITEMQADMYLSARGTDAQKRRGANAYNAWQKSEIAALNSSKCPMHYLMRSLL